MPHELLPLPYAYNALEPYMDARTVEIHHSKHHAAYVNNFNKVLEKAPELFELMPEELLKNLDQIPEPLRPGIRNFGGGHVNHTFFWQSLTPNGGDAPLADSPLGQAIAQTFGNFDAFKEKFTAVAQNHFGSGWGWLSLDRNGNLIIHSTANQDSPYSEGLTPLLTCDVWEHAYYLLYQNRRLDYINAWWNLVNWTEVARRYEVARK